MNRFVVLVILVVYLSGCSMLTPRPTSVSELQSLNNSEVRHYFKRLEELNILKQKRKEDNPSIKELVVTAELAEVSVVESVQAFDLENLETKQIDGFESITSNQEQSVDEGGIIKRVGDYLVVLMKGRVMSVRIPQEPNGRMEQIASYRLQSHAETDDVWFDEMLVFENRILVMAYVYGAGAVEIINLRLSDQGEVTFDDSYLISASDYFDSENYATRIVGNDLHFYLPHYVGDDLDYLEMLLDPMQGYYYSDEKQKGFDGKKVTLAEGGEWFAPVEFIKYPIVHQVVKCPLDKKELRCRTINIIGEGDAVFYVSRTAFYLWVSDVFPACDIFSINDDDYLSRIESGEWSYDKTESKSYFYRIPHGSAEPTVVEAKGYVSSQFGIAERGDEVVVITAVGLNSNNELIYGLTIGLNEFSRESIVLPVERYSLLSDKGYITAQRITADHAFVGTELNEEEHGNTHVWDWNANQTHSIRTSSPMTYFQSVGKTIIGVADDYYESVDLAQIDFKNDLPVLTQELRFKDRMLSESRSHSFASLSLAGQQFFAQPTAKLQGRELNYLDEEDLVDFDYFLVRPHIGIEEAGILEGSDFQSDFEECVSCDDWYGSARTFAISGRIYALLGFELILADHIGGSINESQRIHLK